MRSQDYERLERKLGVQWTRAKEYPLKESYSFDALIDYFDKWYEKQNKEKRIHTYILKKENTFCIKN